MLSQHESNASRVILCYIVSEINTVQEGIAKTEGPIYLARMTGIALCLWSAEALLQCRPAEGRLTARRLLAGPDRGSRESSRPPISA